MSDTWTAAIFACTANGFAQLLPRSRHDYRVTDLQIDETCCVCGKAVDENSDRLLACTYEAANFRCSHVAHRGCRSLHDHRCTPLDLLAPSEAPIARTAQATCHAPRASCNPAADLRSKQTQLQAAPALTFSKQRVQNAHTSSMLGTQSCSKHCQRSERCFSFRTLSPSTNL